MTLRYILIVILTVALGCAQTLETTTTAAPPTPTVTPPADLDLPVSRSFKMGFTTWPHDFDQPAVDWTWRAISEHADMVAIHLDGGIPWQEALDETDYPPLVEAELRDMAERSSVFDTVYVAATPLDSDRASLAGYWNDDGSQQPLPGPWDGRRLADESVIAAYLNHCMKLIDEFEPDYFAYGIEVNGGYAPDSPPHAGMLVLAEAVYTALKAEHPDLPILLTFQIHSWVVGSEQVLNITESFLPYTDIIGISAYPFLELAGPTSDEAEPEPVRDWMGPMGSFGKPIAVTETGFLAEPLVIDSLGIDMASTEQWQAEFVADLLATSDSHGALFVVYWEIRDYDAGYEFLVELGADPALARVWRDIGLYDGGGDPRTALGVWDAWLGLPS